MAKKIFYGIIFTLILVVVILVGATIKIHNPLMLALNILLFGGAFVGGYILGKKSK